MNIILIATECFPFAKATSLGDLVSFLAKGLEKEGHNVKIFIPRYGSIDPTAYQIERLPFELKVNLEGVNITSSVFKGILPNSLTSVFFIESQSHFSNSKEIYFSQLNQSDTQNRNSFFCLAAIEAVSKLKLNADIIHIFNSNCAGFAKLLRSSNTAYSNLKKSKLLFTLHNIDELLDHKNNSMSIKEAINYSDFITTSSKTFEEELLSDIHNIGISDALIKKREVFSGILNSIDEEVYDPGTDSSIAQTYSRGYFSAGKRKCKEDFYSLVNLEKDSQVPLFGMVTRLIKKNGIDLLIQILPEISNLNLHFVVLGKGEEEIEEKLLKAAKNYKNLKVYIGNNHDFAKKIYAASDFYLCPEEIQPIADTALIAMKYGSIPIAFNSGAIKDILNDADSSLNGANSIIFNNPTKEDLFESIIRATKYYKNKEKWTKLVKSVMSFDTSKLNTIKNYINCYEAVINEKKSQEVPLLK